MLGRANSGVMERSEVLELLQAVAPSLFDEVFMVTCMFEDTRVSALRVHSTPGVPSAASDTPPADPADFGVNFELTVAVPIHAVSVAGGTLNTVYLVMSVAAPLSDDAEGDVCPRSIAGADPTHATRGRSAFRVVVKSPLLALSVRQDLAAQLEELRATVGDDGAAITMAALALRMQDLVAGLSVQAQATYFGCCLDCNSKQFKSALRAAAAVTSPAGAAAATGDDQIGPTTNAAAAIAVRKSLQPLHIEFDTAPSPYGASCDGGVMAPRDTVSEYRLAMMTDEERTAQLRRTAYCLTCNSTNIIHVPCAKPGGGRLCSYCMYEESPLLEFDCGCRSCFDCFERYAEMAVGRRAVRQRAHGGPQWGVGCAVHPTTVIWDVGLMKLLDSRTLMRFQAFALNAAVAAAGGFTCANSSCRSGIPQLPTRGGQLLVCIYCCRGTCPQCQRSAVDCECLRLLHATTREMKEIVSRARNDCARVPRNCPATTAAIMLAVGKERLVIPGLDLNDLHWASELHNAAAPYLPQNSVSSGVGLFVFYFLGAPLSPAHPLWCAGVHPGAVIFAVPVWELHQGVVAAEVDLWEFRRGAASSSAVMDDLEGTATATPPEGGAAAIADADGAAAAVPLKNRVIGSRKAAVAAAAAAKAKSNGLFRRCPKCKAPVIHYWGHGCHHIGVVACCGYQWCFLCLEEYPCKRKCPLFCTRTCGCAPCPECKPLMPCAHCQGCPNCSADYDASVFR